MEKATEAREKNNVGALVDETKLALVNIEMENNLADLTVSEKIDKLKENGILNDDMTFVSNSDYSLSYNGNIIDTNGNELNNIQLYNNIETLEVNVQSAATAAVGTRLVKVVNGKVYFYDENNKSSFIIEANPAPEGYKFAYWIDQNNNIIDYTPLFNLSVITDSIYTAIYVKEAETITPKVCVTVYATTHTQDNKLQFQTFSSTPNNADITVGGLLTSNVNLANENQMLAERNTNSAESFFHGNSNFANLKRGVYALSKQNVGTNTWYYRGYITVKNNKTNETQTYYSNIISAHK